MKTHDLIVIGGGPAGMAAAAAAYDRGVTDVAILDREPRPGGILQQCIHNGFGLHKLGRELTGPEYAAVYEEKIRARGIPVYTETTVTGLTAGRVVTARSRDGILKIQAGAVILAMGCRERSRGALSICGSRPAGIYSAGTAQKLMNIEGYLVGKRVVILGSGDIGLIMARRLSLEGARVEAVCELLPYSGGLKRNIVQCLEDFGIPLYLSTTVAQIHGQDRLEGVTIAQVDEARRPIDATRRLIPCDTLLLSVGLIPENELSRACGVALDPVTGGPVVDERCMTSVPGVFACGNVLQVHDLVDYVSDEAERAGACAAAYLQSGAPRADAFETRAGNGVRYVLPQRIRPEDEDLGLFLRVQKPYGPVRFVVRCGEQVLLQAKRLRAAPGEMEKLTLRAAQRRLIDGPVTVELEELP